MMTTQLHLVKSGFNTIWYVFPMWKHVSFSVIGWKHLEELKKKLRVTPIEETAFPNILVYSYPTVILHPYFYPFEKYEEKIRHKRHKIKSIIGIDVADSTSITKYAVELTNHADAMIVPSTFAKTAYVRSGVKKPVYVIPHGVDDEFLNTPKHQPNVFKALSDLKEKRKAHLIHCWILHSEYRKGLDLLVEFHNKLIKERNDVILVVKTMHGVGYITRPIENFDGILEHYMDKLIKKEWLTEQEKMELLDVCDLYILTSRGGGFEHPPLEAMVRGEIAIGAKGGAWEDYMPKWALIDSKKSGKIFKDNPIHNGYGVEMKIDKAVDKTVEILNNLDDYKARINEYVNTYVKENLTWTKIGEQLTNIILKHI